MKTEDFDYFLPESLIAAYPMKNRAESRLLVQDNQGRLNHHIFCELPTLLHENDCLIFNDSRVIKARLLGQKESGGKVECLIERVLDDHHAIAHIGASKSPKAGSTLQIGSYTLTMTHREGTLFHLESSENFWEILENQGHLPLPHYMNRKDEPLDESRYQTVYANEKGSVAAPTAGLHFDDALLATLKAKGIQTGFVTLHVGAGTFQPVRVENIQDHHMHTERYTLPQATVDLIKRTQAKGGRVIAVGTTTVRTLESASQKGTLSAHSGETDIFISPGYTFQVVDAMITNFHLPKSSLLMLVSAFTGLDAIRHAYQTAIQESYRFFSYGDAMLLLRR